MDMSINVHQMEEGWLSPFVDDVAFIVVVVVVVVVVAVVVAVVVVDVVVDIFNLIYTCRC